AAPAQASRFGEEERLAETRAPAAAARNCGPEESRLQFPDRCLAAWAVKIDRPRSARRAGPGPLRHPLAPRRWSLVGRVPERLPRAPVRAVGSLHVGAVEQMGIGGSPVPRRQRPGPHRRLTQTALTFFGPVRRMPPLSRPVPATLWNRRWL